jgi:hypothetical protein
MAQQMQRSIAQTAGVSIAFALAAQPNRAMAFQSTMAAVLHAGFAFGRDRPGQLVYSYDPQGEEYAPPLVVPVGTITSLIQAVEYLAQAAQHYNQSIGLTFTCPHGSTAVTERVYDEPDSLIISLDFEQASWQQLVAACHSLRTATMALLDVGRTLFTLVPMRYLLIGPTRLLRDLPQSPSHRLLHTMPIAIVNTSEPRRLPALDALHVEHLPRGNVIIRCWDASIAAPSRIEPKQPARKQARSRRRIGKSR